MVIVIGRPAARLLNFTRAAEELNLTQGAISHQIRELESLLGQKLFDRQARGLALTEAGVLYTYLSSAKLSTGCAQVLRRLEDSGRTAF